MSKPKPKAKAKVKKATAPVREYHTVTKGKDNHYGTRNAIAHGRFAQGGIIDYMFAQSMKTGKPFSLAQLNEQREKDNDSRPETPPVNSINYSRFDGHKQHIIGVHGAKVYDETQEVKNPKTGEKEKVKFYGMDWVDAEPMTTTKGEPITKADFLECLNH